MIIEKIIGNVDDVGIDGRHVERVFLSSDDLVKRIQRVTTDHGNEVGIRLKDPIELIDGDILYMDDTKAIVLKVTADDLLVIRPNSIKQMGEIAHQLGNRHMPAQFEEQEMLIQYDYLIEEMLQRLGIPYSREERRVKQAFRHIGHKHG